MHLPKESTGDFGLKSVSQPLLDGEGRSNPALKEERSVHRGHRRRYAVGMSPPFRKPGPFLALASVLIVALLFVSAIPFAASHQNANLLSSQSPIVPASSSFSVTGDDVALGQKSANLTVTTATSKYKVFSEEYAIIVDYSTSFIEYQIRPYYSTDYSTYKRANPQYAGDGTIDQSGAALDSVAMKISSWGKSGNNVWFLESCTEFSLKQSFTIFRDYFELNVTYMPGTKKVLTTYYFDLHSSGGSRYGLISDSHFNRYIPGFPEDTPSGYGLGGWYPSFKMYAPAADIRARGSNLGLEWGYEDAVAYIGSPLWLSGGSGGASVMALKYTSLNAIVPNISLGEAETFHMFVRPYKYSDGKDMGYDVGYANWVSPRIAAKYGNHNTPVFPLTEMNLNTWSTDMRTWVENSQMKVAVQSNNLGQINWHYKSARMANKNPDTPSSVPTSWQIMQKGNVPLTLSDGSVVCNPVSGPYTTTGTYRWQLINNDPQQAWWTSSAGVFWDEVNLWTSTNNPVNDYSQGRSDYLYEGYLALIKESYASGYWDYVIANSFTALLHLSIAADLTCIEGYEPSSTYGTDFTKHVWSTMDFVNNIPAAYRPKILVYQNYDTGSTNDQSDVYSALFGAAKYGFMVDLMSYNSFTGQKHNLQMAEDMFKAMGYTRDSDVRTVKVGTLDLAQSSTLVTGASMVVVKGTGTPAITSTTTPDKFKLTNLLATSRDFDVGFSSPYYYGAGTNVGSAYETFTTDGKSVFHGSIASEKTGEVVKNANLQVQQKTSGSMKVSSVSLGTTAVKMSLASTGGSTTIIIKGLKASTSFSVLVNGAVVTTITSGSDGSLSFSRAFGGSDVFELKTGGSSSPPPDPPPIPPPSGQGIVRLNPVSDDITTLNDVDLQYKITDTNGNPVVKGLVTFYIQHYNGGAVYAWGSALTDSQGIAHLVYKALSVTGGVTPGKTEYYNAWAVYSGMEGAHIKVHLQAG